MVFNGILCVGIADSVIVIMATIAFKFFFYMFCWCGSVTIFCFFPIAYNSINSDKF